MATRVCNAGDSYRPGSAGSGAKGLERLGGRLPRLGRLPASELNLDVLVAILHGGHESLHVAVAGHPLGDWDLRVDAYKQLAPL